MKKQKFPTHKSYIIKKNDSARQKPEIKTVIFDLGGVIVYYDHMRAAKPMSKLIKIPAKKIYGLFNGQKNKFTLSYEKGIPINQCWKIAQKELKSKSISARKFNKIWTEIFWPNNPVIKLIRKLKNKYKIAALSNIGALHANYLSEKYKFSQLFDKNIYSYKVKARKPDKRIYQTALKQLKVKPNEAIFIDDRIENAKAAQKLGINGIHFKNNAQLMRELRKLGVKL